jgi:L-ribulose-5-phosphate 3-epimerase
MNRRQFTRKTAMASMLFSTVSFPVFKDLTIPPAISYKKGIMWGGIGVGKTILERFQAARDAGFDGVEVDSHLSREEVLRARDLTGLLIPSVCDSKHWKLLLSSPDPKVRNEGSEALKVAIEDAAAYGADTVLLVPGRVNEEISYDECWSRSAEEIKKVIPVAEKLNVRIAVENVWNNFLLSPMEAANYIDQFGSQAVGAYFDVGNILAYGWPEQWIKILGKRIAKVHIKEYSRKIADAQGKSAGFKVKLTEGDVNWHAVMKALDESGYSGWTTVEMSGGNTPEGLKDLCDRLKIILAS